jgi:hypothetical protein
VKKTNSAVGENQTEMKTPGAVQGGSPHLHDSGAASSAGTSRSCFRSGMSRLKFPGIHWIAAAFLVLILSIEGPAAPKAFAESASSLFKKGQAAETRDDIDGAYQFYTKAFQKDPTNVRYKTAYERVRFSAAAMHTKRGERLRAQGDSVGALTEFMRALEIDEAYELAQQDIDAAKRAMGSTDVRQETSVGPAALSEMSEMSSPVKLKPISNEPLTLHMVEDSKVVYQTVGKAAGINVLFDPITTVSGSRSISRTSPSTTPCTSSARSPAHSGVPLRRILFLSRKTPGQSAPNWTSKRSRPFTFRTRRSRTT